MLTVGALELPPGCQHGRPGDGPQPRREAWNGLVELHADRVGWPSVVAGFVRDLRCGEKKKGTGRARTGNGRVEEKEEKAERRTEAS